MAKMNVIFYIYILLSLTSITHSLLHNLANPASDASEKKGFQNKCKFDSRITDLKILNVELNKKIVDMDKNNQEDIDQLNHEIEILKKELTKVKNENKQLVEANQSLKLLNNDNGLVSNPTEASKQGDSELRHEMDDDNHSKLRSDSSEDTTEHRSLKLKVIDLENEKEDLVQDYENSIMKLQHDKEILEFRVQVLQDECDNNKDIFTKISIQIVEGFSNVGNKIDSIEQHLHIIGSNNTTCNCSAVIHPDEIMHHHKATNITFVSDNGDVQHLTPVKLKNEAQELGEPSVHFFSKLQNELKVGQQIDIYAKIPAYLHSNMFAINFWQVIGLKRTHCIFHFNPRFENFNKGAPLHGSVVIRNSLLEYGWGKEESTSPQEFPFVPGKEFHLTIICESKQFNVFINGKEYITFEYRANISAINAIDITHDVFVNEVVYTS